MRAGRTAGATIAVVAMLATACGAGDVGPSPAETRTVTHDGGETEIPADPQRVVILDDDAILGSALLHEVPIVGYTPLPFADGVLPYFDATPLSDAVDVGEDVNIERVAAAAPDLIVANGSKAEDIVPQLEQIAPTVTFDPPFSPWKESQREIAAVFEEDAERIEQGLTEYEARTAEIRSSLGDRQGAEVTLANFRALDDIRVYPTDWCSGQALEEVGLTRPAVQPGEERVDLSIERLGELDAELLLYFVGSTATDPQEASQAEAQIMANPLWDTLEVTQSGETYSVDPNHWFTCGSLQAQNLVLDDLESILLGEG